MAWRPTTHGPEAEAARWGISSTIEGSLRSAHKASEDSHLPAARERPFAVDPASLGAPFKHTQYPYVTGGSLLALKYKDGVVVACDTLGSYGSTKRYKNVTRIFKINDNCVIAGAGELSDFSYIVDLLAEFTMDDFCADDDIQIGPAEVYSILCRIIYKRRTRLDPLWNSLIIAGLQDGKPFLGWVGMIGTHYVDDTIATGMGIHLARPLFTQHYKPDMTEEEATELINMALRVTFYRDSMMMNKFQIAKVTKDAVSISEPYSVSTAWDYELFKNPTLHGLGSW